MHAVTRREVREIPFERPMFFLGLVGFSQQEEKGLREAIGRAVSGQVLWRVSSFALADAWLVNGARTTLVTESDLLVAPANAASTPVQFSLEDVDRPISFAEPMPPDFDPAIRFSQDSQPSIHGALGRIALWLRPRSSQLCLASQLVAQEEDLAMGGVYHVHSGGRLIAVVDMRGDTGVLKTATPADFEDATWTLRPHSARYIPETFERASMSALMWQYATRSERELLPERYRVQKIHFRRPPKLPARDIGDAHLRLMRDLSLRPRTFRELQADTGTPASQLARELAALYFVGSITTNAKRAGRPGVHERQVVPGAPDSRADSGWPSHPPPRPQWYPPRLDNTAPANLR